MNSHTAALRKSKSDLRALQPGYMLGNYRIECLIGRGGFAFTYLATGGGESFVIKELFPDGVVRDTQTGAVRLASESSESSLFRFAYSRFDEEARTLMTLNRYKHPNVVKISDCFGANYTAYMIMPYIPGQDLNDYIRAQEPENGRAYQMPEDQIRHYLDGVLDALDYVHRQGIYHRDLKPENIYITDQGAPIVLDFGAAKVMNYWNRKEHGANNSVLFESGCYTPYEQLSRLHAVGPWTDIYALGATLHVLINPNRDRIKREGSAHVAPYRGAEPPKSNERVHQDPYQRLSGRRDLAAQYSPGLLAGIDWALEYHPHHRPQSIGDWKSCLNSPRGERVSYGSNGSNVPTGITSPNGMHTYERSGGGNLGNSNPTELLGGGGGPMLAGVGAGGGVVTYKPGLPFWKIFLIVLFIFTLLAAIITVALLSKDLWHH